MSVNSDTLCRGFAESAIKELREASRVVTHCVDQLSDDQLWSRPAAEMNSIANLLLHLNGNLRQWIVAGVGGAIDERDRTREFSERGGVAGKELVARLGQTIVEAEASIRRQSPDDLLRSRRIQGSEHSGLDAIIGSISHFRGHTQEIVHMTRSLLGAAYRFNFVPQTPEQGAPR